MQSYGKQKRAHSRANWPDTVALLEKDEEFKNIQKSRTKVSPAVTGGASFSTVAFSTVTCSISEEFGFCSLREGDVDPTLEEL